MALTFPLSLAQFFAAMPFREDGVQFGLNAGVQSSQTQGGEIVTADVATRLWSGTVSLDTMRNDMADGVLARIDALTYAGRTFMAHNPRRRGPIADPLGAALGASTPQIHTLDANARELRLIGLPPGYVLTAGDMVAFSYGAVPVRFALHRIVVGGVADGAGLTPLIEVAPNIRPGASVGAAVTLIRPACKALIVPGSVSTGNRGRRHTSGIGFSFIQTLR